MLLLNSTLSSHRSQISHSLALPLCKRIAARYGSLLLWVCCLLICPNLAHANESNSLPSASSIAQAPPPEPELEINLTGERRRDLPTSAPIYTIDRQQIQQQGSKSVADILKTLPGFAINDAGFGADIHTGTYYRGASINQSIILLNGRPIGSNINTYHGGTDLNSIPVDSIDRIELSSGASNIIYGSEAFGGVVNIIRSEERRGGKEC